MKAYSYHIFFLPFQWDYLRSEMTPDNMTFSDRIDVSQFVKSLKNNCWRKFSEHEDFPIEFYNDALFFYDSVRKSVFGSLNSAEYSSRIQPTQEDFTVKNLAFQHEASLTYTVKTKSHGSFNLLLEKIRLNIYSTGIGILSFYLANQKKEISDKESILYINDFGRRLFPTFLTLNGDDDSRLLKDPQEHSSLPLEITITEEGRQEPIFFEDYSDFARIREYVKKQPNSLPNGSKNLLNGLLGESFTLESFRDISQDQIIIRPTLDDRMFAVCWFAKNRESKKLKWNPKTNIYGFQDHQKAEYWMRFLFMESGDGSAQSRLMRRALADQHTYHRWADYGTFYGVTRSTFVCLTDESDFAKTIISRHMWRLYPEMVQLTLAQHACTLRFSDEIGRLRKKNKEELLNSGAVQFLYKRYLEFVNHLDYRVITPLEQGQELYQKLQFGLEIGPNTTKLEREMGEFNHLVNRLEEQERSRMNTWFSFLATIFTPASIIAAVLGMSTLGDNFQFWGGSIHWNFLISTSLVLFASFIFWFLNRKKFNGSTIFQNKITDI